MKYYDITPTITPEMAVFPGDVRFKRHIAMSFEEGHHLTLSSINTTVHIGAHTDAPNHYSPEGEDMASRSLHHYLGRCQVVHISLPRGERIYPTHLGEIKAKRVLLGTGSFPNPYQWNDDFNSLSPELVHFLADSGVVLVGIDTPSIDPASSQALESHNAVSSRDLAILEGIVLTEVPAGVYQLIALPLKIQGADASPVRAILTPLES